MAKFKFQLEGLLKLREFKEDQLRNQMGEIVKKMNDVKDEILQLHSSIDEAYRSQEKALHKSDAARTAHFFDYFIRGNRQQLKDKEALLFSLQKKYDKKSQELAVAMGEVKVMNKLKEKQLDLFKKAIEKKEQDAIDEIVIMRSIREEKVL